MQSKKDELLRELIRHGCVPLKTNWRRNPGCRLENMIIRESGDVATENPSVRDSYHTMVTS
ncbi:MAG: hypothetical protein V8T45_06785 [Oscillospiraceae bacterium]